MKKICKCCDLTIFFKPLLFFPDSGKLRNLLDQRYLNDSLLVQNTSVLLNRTDQGINSRRRITLLLWRLAVIPESCKSSRQKMIKLKMTPPLDNGRMKNWLLIIPLWKRRGHEIAYKFSIQLQFARRPQDRLMSLKQWEMRE